LRRPERALEALQRGLGERDPWLVWIGVDPMLDPLRGRPEFQEIRAGVLA
jgi:hypothetical protein